VNRDWRGFSGGMEDDLGAGPTPPSRTRAGPPNGSAAQARGPALELST